MFNFKYCTCVLVFHGLLSYLLLWYLCLGRYLCWCGSFPENSLSQLIILHLPSYCLCTLPIQNIIILYRAHIFLLRSCTELWCNWTSSLSMMFTTLNFLELWNFLELIDRCAESERVRYRSHAAKITRTFQQSIKAGDFAHNQRLSV